MRDFTLDTYASLMDSLKDSGRVFHHVQDYYKIAETNQNVLLRQDVDYSKTNALKIARIQSERGIRSTFYFRTIPLVYDPEIIQQIADLGHEIGYHYETMDKARGNISKAYDLFCRELEGLRKMYPVKTVCMHGSPLSKYDNRTIWTQYSYKELGLIFEPYFDMDFNKFFYLTDTGRRWDGASVSIRDKAMDSNPVTNEAFLKIDHHSTFDVINSINVGEIPSNLMITCHPNRWNDEVSKWMRELVMQNIKNTAKYAIVKLKSGK